MRGPEDYCPLGKLAAGFMKPRIERPSLGVLRDRVEQDGAAAGDLGGAEGSQRRIPQER